MYKVQSTKKFEYYCQHNIVYIVPWAADSAAVQYIPLVQETLTTELVIVMRENRFRKQVVKDPFQRSGSETIKFAYLVFGNTQA